MKASSNKGLKVLRNTIIGIILIVVLFFSVNIIYLFFSYHRIDDNQTLDVSNAANLEYGQRTPLGGINYSVMSYNIGFSAYTPDFSFFMDGGTQSWANSEESVKKDTQDIANFVAGQNADFVSLQEVDSDSTRTYHVNEMDMIRNALPNYSDVNACCFDSPFLFWPPWQPHGKSVSNIMTLSKYNPITEGLRRQLPVDGGVTKILDYDRCYSKTRYMTENAKELVFFNTHLSAYSKEEETANMQIEMLVKDMQNEYDKGNYVICAGDFNKQIVENPEAYFPPNKVKETKLFPFDYLAGTNIHVVAPFDAANPVGTCRYAGAPLSESTTVSNIDGFLVSDNIRVMEAHVVDTNYAYSDHNPVFMTFRIL